MSIYQIRTWKTNRSVNTPLVKISNSERQYSDTYFRQQTLPLKNKNQTTDTGEQVLTEKSFFKTFFQKKTIDTGEELVSEKLNIWSIIRRKTAKQI